MTVRIFFIKCPKCSRGMQTYTNKRNPEGNQKECVFCGKKFQIKKDNIIYRVK